MSETTNTVSQILQSASGFLSSKGVSNPRHAVELLLSRLLGCKHLELALKSDNVLTEKQLAAMRRGVKRVAAGEPVQHVLGEAGFMGHTFKVDRRALIPRPETEVLVETVLKCDALWSAERPALVESGVGSGCVIISLALAKPDALYVGLDVSAEALELAKENAATLGVSDRIALAAGDMSDVVDPESLDAIVSNPPYIPTTEIDRLPVEIRDHEPRVALDGGPRGLSVVDALVQDAVICLKPGGFLFTEIGDGQAGPVTTMFGEAGFSDVAVEKDLAGRDRIVWGRAETV